FARAVDACDENDKWPRRYLQRLCHGHEHLFDLADEYSLNLVRRNCLLETPLAKHFGDARGEIQPKVGPDQFVFPSLQCFGIELAFRPQTGDRTSERR